MRRSTERISLQENLPSRTSIPRVWDTKKRPFDKPEQTTDTILMVAPHGFCSNAETAVDNHFMKNNSASAIEIEHKVPSPSSSVRWSSSPYPLAYKRIRHFKALLEFSALHKEFVKAGIRVVLHSNEGGVDTPDAVFPNNWFSAHSAENDNKESTVVFYPMKTPSRRCI